MHYPERSADASGGAVPPWYALCTRHQHEKTVARSLTGKGFEVFLPLYRALHRWKDGLQKTARVFNALTCHLEHQMMFVIVATLLHSTRQMFREEPAGRLQDLVAQVRWKEA